MEDYLRKILHEYERYRPELDIGNAVLFNSFIRLDEFTGSTGREFRYPPDVKPEKQYRLFKNFTDPYPILRTLLEW
jgi:hypothetical protein